jgi:hypothetical protein
MDETHVRCRGATSAPPIRLGRKSAIKRLLIVLAIAVALLAVLAAPALATRSNSNWRPNLKTAYVFTYNGGSWFEAIGDPSAPTLIGHWADFDEETGSWVVGTADPIPANYDVVMQLSWELYPSGQVQTLPKKFLISLIIPEAGVSLSYAQSKAYWTFHLWDQYWVDALGLWPAFNPHIGAQLYSNTWLAPLTGESGLATNRTGVWKLPAGTYTVTETERVVQPFTTIELVYDDQGNPLWGPTHYTPGTSDPLVFTFTVAAPVP